MLNDAWDVVVVGAGPAGATMAALLARRGRSVALIDAAHFPRQKVCGEYLSAAAWKLLETLDLDVPRSLAMPLRSLVLSASTGRNVEVAYAPDVARQPAALGRDVFDLRLVEAAQRAGATLLCGVRLRAVLRSGRRAVGVEVVDVADPSSGRELRAPLIVAADGRRSRVVQETGSFQLAHSEIVGFKRHVPVADFAAYENRIAMHAAPGCYIGVCPVAPGVVNLCGTMPKRAMQQAHGRIGAALQSLLPRATPLAPLLADSTVPLAAWHSMPEVAQQRSRHEMPGVLYIGDAMGTIEPLTGQGMTMALAGAQLAASLLHEADATTADVELQARYEGEWRRQFAGSIAAAAWFGRILRRPRLLQGLLATSRLLPGFTNALVQRAHRRTLTVET
ncbi:MAG: hypothetical protein C0483_08685 [Pirellula sp.]|nr:hypothetical protein [Pirellula sp.]